MRRRTRIHYTESQKSQMWDPWQPGESLHQIAQLFDRHHSSVRGILAASGGIRPRPRCRSPRTLKHGTCNFQLCYPINMLLIVYL